MERVGTLIIGAGISGLATAAFSRDSDYLVLEAESEPGGYCRTVKQDGFVWDYSGHFFHFRHPDIEAYLRERMPGQRVRTVARKSVISYGGGRVDFPFQKNIHQLPREEFLECLTDLFFARAPALGLVPGEAPPRESNFKEMLYARFGRGITERFLVPYNEKLYACDLSTLDVDAMGRFFPHADLVDVMKNFRVADNGSYNASFTYPEGGAVEYVNALAREVKTGKLALSEPVVAIDFERRVAKTPRREIGYERLVSSVPFPRLLSLGGVPFEASAFSWNKVLVFNLGFDRKGERGVHWVYFPNRARSFYRVGFYDNIFDSERMSLYVELGFARDAQVDAAALLPRVLQDLRDEGIVQGHQLVSHHSVVMDPAYVHVTRAAQAEQARLVPWLAARGVHSIGRYGGWTYCSIEDNIVEARALARAVSAR